MKSQPHTPKRAVVLVGHGSKLPGSSEALDRVLEALREKEPDTFFQSAFLAVCSPDISEGIAICLSQGAQEVVVIPYFVQSGKHVVEDIPRIISQEQTKYPDKSIQLGEYLSFDERIVSLVFDRVHETRTAHR